MMSLVGVSLGVILAQLMSLACLVGIIWLLVFLVQRNKKQRQEELDKLIDSKVEIKLKELQQTQNLPSNQDTDESTTS